MKAPGGLHVRDEKVEGIGPWLWVKNDKWAWEHPAPEFPQLRDLFLAHTKRRKVILQAGGCMGMYPRLWAEHFDMVYTFEPEPTNFYCLVANCPDPRIIKMQAALGDEPRMGSMRLHQEVNSGAHILTPVPGDVPVLTIDSFKFITLDAIQLDCEGSERKILAGASNTLMRHKPVISLEAPTEDCVLLLKYFGYREVGQCGTMPDVVFAVPN